jgi:site-specific DNA-methyltransferase (adenine-specific)
MLCSASNEPNSDAHNLWEGDNLVILREQIPSESIDLVYLDPPFNTADERTVEWGPDREVRSFEDSFGSIGLYLEWIVPRLIECARTLRPGAAMFLHCDWRTSHYLRVELDKIFGYGNFINEIVWKRHNAHSDWKQGSRHFGRNFDSILYYSKGEPRTWHALYQPYDPDYVSRVYRYTDEEGRAYALTDLSGPGGAANRNPVFDFLGVERPWRYSKEKMASLLSEGRIVLTAGAKVPRRKRYLDEMQGREVQTVWDDIPRCAGSELVGYPTQKPLALLERVVACASDVGDMVLDPFCGSGTTLVAAARLGRRSIGIDQESKAIAVTRDRLANCRAGQDLRADLIEATSSSSTSN